MIQFRLALETEISKVLKSKMLWATFLFFAVIAVMLGFIMLIAKHPEIGEKSALVSMKASLIGSPVWPVYYQLLIQMVLTVGSLGPSIVAIWVFGREYSDRTVKDILVLPVSRQNIVMAKFFVVLIWSLLLLVTFYGFSIIMGLLINLDGWMTELFLQNFKIYTVSALLTVILVPVIAFITCLSRGYLLPVGITIFILITTQFVYIGMPGITPFFPWALAGLYSGAAGPASPQPETVSYIITIITSILGITGTAAWWRYADHH